MTVTSSVQDTSSSTDGVSTDFQIPFYFLDNTHIVVDKIDANGGLTRLTYGTDYTVSGAGDVNGGTLTTLSVFARGFTLHIYRDVPATQETEYQQNDPFPAKTTEKALDKLTMIAQQNAAAVQNSIRFPISEYGRDGTLPSALQRAMNVLGFDAAGNVSMLPMPASVGAGDLRDEIFVAGTDFAPGVDSSVTLSRSYGTKANMSVSMDASPQGADTFRLNGTTLTFLDANGNPTAIPYGVQKIYVKGGTTLSVYTPPDESVTDATIAPGSLLSIRTQDWVSVSDFDVRFDGTDQTAKLQLGLDNFGQRGGGRILFPPRGLVRANGLTINYPNITFEGNYSQAGGLLLDRMVQVKQPRFSARGMYVRRNPSATWTGDDFSSGFLVYNKDVGVTMSDFAFVDNEFDGFFFAVNFMGEFDYLPASLGPSHTTNPIFNTTVERCKSTAAAGRNAGHFQHLMTRNSRTAFNRTYLGQNCSSHNFYRDCRNVSVIGNYDESSKWGGCEIENSPLANAVVAFNNFMSTDAAQSASIWIDDAADCRVIGNVCAWDIWVTCGNVADPSSGGLYPGETCALTFAEIDNNTARLLFSGLFSSYVSGNTRADFTRNKVFGASTQGLFTDSKYQGGRVALNDFRQGTFTYSMNIARSAGLNVQVHDNSMGVAPVFPGVGGSVRAYNNDVSFAEQTQQNTPVAVISGGQVRPSQAPGFQIAGGATGYFNFSVPTTVAQYSLTDYEFKILSRNTNNGDMDVITFNALVDNPSGTPNATVTSLTKRRSNTASNLTVVVGLVGTTLTVAVTNTQAAPNTLSVACAASGMVPL
ncbi:hypothetical protein [Burkholderia multivorans]|uniref:hypothetical protein n=1 Tax=Burkholderia multivorans TaxID=87883 RepID=UPI0015E3DA69|nr:hypothetical protein [Burkholderia multivorans]